MKRTSIERHAVSWNQAERKERLFFEPSKFRALHHKSVQSRYQVNFSTFCIRELVGLLPA